MFKEYLEDKAIGFYVTAGAAVLSLLAGIVYVVGFGSIDATEFTSWGAFVVLLLGFLLTAALLVLPMFLPFLKELALPIAPWVVGGASWLSFILYVPSAFAYINANATGSFSLEAGLVLSAVFVILAAIAGTVAACMKVIKKQSEAAVKDADATQEA